MLAKIIWLSIFILILAGPNGRAQSLVYNSMASGSNWDQQGWLAPAYAPEYAGQIFTSSTAGDLDQVVLGLTTAFGGPFAVNVALYTWTYGAGNSGYIGSSPLESWNPTIAGDPTANTASPLSLSSALKPYLAAGQSYVFVTAILSGPVGDEVVWADAPYPYPYPNGGECYTYGGTNYNYSIGEVSLQVYVNPSAAPPANLTGISLAGHDLVVYGNNGVSGSTNFLLMAASPTLPLGQWTPIATNILSVSGNFSFTATNAVDPSAPQRFYILQE